MIRCEICQQSEDDFDCHVEVAERLPINYHPVVLCTECMRKLSQNLVSSTEFIAYQASLDYCNSLRDNYTTEITEDDIHHANEIYCMKLRACGAKMMERIEALKNQ